MGLYLGKLVRFRNMKKVLLVYHALSSGSFSYAGMEKMLVWLGNSLAENGFDITFCTLFDTERCEKYSNNVKSIELGLPYYNSFFKRNLVTFGLGIKRLWFVLRKNNYDYIINFGDIVFFLALILKPFNHFTLITSERGDPYNSSDILERLRRKLIKYSDKIVFQTKGARDFFSQIVKDKSVIIANPIVIPLEVWKQETAQKRIVFIGRIDFWQKRPDLLVQAFSIVHKKYPEYLLDICGSGSELDRLRDIIKQLNLVNKVIIHGAVNNVKEFLLQDEVFVLTSDFEGIPNALLEAMAIGMPVVSTDCSPGGAALLIENGVNGFLVPRGNSSAIADAIINLISNKKKAKLMAEEARRSMSLYTSEIIIAKWKKILEE